MDARTRPAPRLIYVVTEDWYFLSHRRGARRPRRRLEVHVAINAAVTSLPSRAKASRCIPCVSCAAGCRRSERRHHPRLAPGPPRVAPAIVHHVALQASVLGVVAAFGRGGAKSTQYRLGHAFITSVRQGALHALRHPDAAAVGLNRRRAVGLVQNPDDRDMLAELGVEPDHIVIIPGSGIDVDRLRPIPEPDGPVTIAYVGRMLDDKGVRNLIAAFRIVRETDAEPGCCSPARPTPPIPPAFRRTSWPPGDGARRHLARTGRRHRHRLAARPIAVLPSRREGLPKSLLEAAACGRPLIATDVPGCREIAITEKTGLLVPVDDPAALAAAMERLARSSQQRIRFGVAARRLVDERFAGDLIGKAIVELYQACSSVTGDRRWGCGTSR